MNYKNTLLITFPVDLGNRTLESNFQAIFIEDMDNYRFAKEHATDANSGMTTLTKSIGYRFKSALGLRKIVSDYTKQGKNIVFHGISPALFSYGIWKPSNTSIIVDWTRGLYPSTLREPFKKDIIFTIHRKLLSACPRILCQTDAVRENLINVYGVNRSSTFKVLAPFQVEKLDIPPRHTPTRPRVLFAGGDLKRKGGDIILEALRKGMFDKCSLTMMTNDSAADVNGVNFLPGVKYGSEQHRKAFEDHDILILPTRIDSYPQVVGEAAAAGLAVITTKFALGATEVVLDGQTGYITDTPTQCIDRLQDLLNNPSLIDDFKIQGYKVMHKKFSREAIRKSYLQVIERDI
ncbi:glycosyltransferase family 4 protein [Dyadobacter sp. CY323]|uniref:glycosyltransferase family 4 protein n=1 Tax=Dyadobacter sp. CY323 TaxID=2907302 RepID=UPI001F460D7A|nr:glycosyltransferase family 4 protein [Dyadobacter sp. CY323]MCE6991388.1 glycosyltransferase family 4 protein [Dyadobacter sp. CY323]